MSANPCPTHLSSTANEPIQPTGAWHWVRHILLWIYSWIFPAKEVLVFSTANGKPEVNFEMLKSAINANGNAILNIGCVTHGSDLAATLASKDLESTQYTYLPSNLRRLERVSRFEVHSEDIIEENGYYRVYAAKVKGKAAFVKEFYGKDAEKNWVNSAKFHAATSLSPQLVKLLGTSDELELTATEHNSQFSPFLIFDAARPLECLPEMMKQSEHPDLSLNTITGLRFYLLLSGIENAIEYLDLQAICFQLKCGLDARLYLRPHRYHTFLGIQPVIDLSFAASGTTMTPASKPVSARIYTMDLYAMLFSRLSILKFPPDHEAYNGPHPSGKGTGTAPKPGIFGAKEPHPSGKSISTTPEPGIFGIVISRLQFALLKESYSLGRYLYPASLVIRLFESSSPNDSRFAIFFICQSGERPSFSEVIKRAHEIGSITQVERDSRLSKIKITEFEEPSEEEIHGDSDSNGE